MYPHEIGRQDPDPHRSDQLDPDPSVLQMTSQNVWNMSLFEPFLRFWAFILKLGSGSAWKWHYYRWNFFSLNRSDGVLKKSVFSYGTDFRNVHLTLVKSAPKKVLPIKPNLLGLQLAYTFLAKTFLLLNFLPRSKIHFWNKQVLDFHRPSKLLCRTTSKLWNFIKKHWSLIAACIFMKNKSARTKVV